MIDSKQLFGVVLADPRWFRVLFVPLESEYFVKEKREIVLLNHDSLSRYRHFLTEFGDLEPFLNNRMVASYLGIPGRFLTKPITQY